MDYEEKMASLRNVAGKALILVLLTDGAKLLWKLANIDCTVPPFDEKYH
jgi:hypothetical protein